MVSEENANKEVSDIEKQDHVSCKSNEKQKQEEDDLEKVKLKTPRMYPVRNASSLNKSHCLLAKTLRKCMKFYTALHINYV